MSSTNNTSPPTTTPSTSSKFNPSMAIIIVVLLAALLVVAIFSMYIRRCTQGEDDNHQGAENRAQSVHFYDRPGEGLDKEIIDTLPVVSYSVVKTMKEGKEDAECAVCLEKFEEDETLRLLPKCSHVFHSECIDVWFLSHSTCPLCRTSLTPTSDEANAGVPAVGEVSRRILEAQELFGSSRQASRDFVLQEDDFLEGSSREMGRDNENERNSARLALFRNSDSFRQAARGVEVRERLGTLSARYPESPSEFSKAPQRALSLGCVHLSLPRTGSPSASGRREFNSEIFKYGSPRYGAAGTPLTISLGGRDSQNERELRKSGDLSNIKFSAPLVEEGPSSSGSSEQWITLDLQGVTSVSPHVQTPNVQFTAKLDIPDTETTPIIRPLSRKPRSGPLGGKHVRTTSAKTGSAYEERVRTDRGSFRGLRGSFSLHRSVSEGRSQVDALQHVPAPTELAALEVIGGPHADATPSIDRVNATFAQRAVHWLAGGNKHRRSSSAMASSEQRSVLQQIVTE